jgi:hypothetical protein
MTFHAHEHETHRAGPCDCPVHRTAARAGARETGSPWWLSVAPVLACAFCPACLSVWAPTLSVLGVGIAWTESQHVAALALAVTIALVPAALAARRRGRVGPLVATLVGSALLVAGHLTGGKHILEVTGMAALLAGAALGRRPAAPTPEEGLEA